MLSRAQCSSTSSSRAMTLEVCRPFLRLVDNTEDFNDCSANTVGNGHPRSADNEFSCIFNPSFAAQVQLLAKGSSGVANARSDLAGGGGRPSRGRRTTPPA
jgi:hypothetical protein